MKSTPTKQTTLNALSVSAFVLAAQMAIAGAAGAAAAAPSAASASPNTTLAAAGGTPHTTGAPAARAGSSATVASDAAVARGKYLVSIMVCNDCHTPWKMTPKGPEPDMSRMLSGHPQDMAVTAPPAPPAGGPWSWAGAGTMTAFAGPWGVSFTANLTPDPETGLGKWTSDTFIAALRTGRHEGQGRPILPPMPWPMYRNATDEDLRAIFAYLRSIPPVKNRVPQPIEPPETR